MASSNDRSSSGSDDDDGDSVFFDASSSLSPGEISTCSHRPLQNEPRWRISSKNDSSKPPEHFCTIPLTDSQVHDIERRGKLQRLRSQGAKTSGTSNSVISSSSSPSSVIRQESNTENTSSTPDLLRDHLNSELIGRRQQASLSSTPKQSLINSTARTDNNKQQRSLPHSTLPSGISRRTSDDYYGNGKNLSAISEPNIVDLSIIDRIMKFGESSPNGGKLNDDEILQRPIVRDLDSGKYMPLIDANPMTQTILERVNASGGNVIRSRHNSFLKNHSLRRNSSDHHSHPMSSLEDSLARLKRKSTGNDEDENASTSSESSSTKSSHTTAMSSESAASKSSASMKRSATSFFRGGKRQLTKLLTRNFLRRRGHKHRADQPEVADLDDEEDEGERLLINDGSNGDLKYKASRNLKDQTQFDKTQLLQTIVGAHDGPIWCMRFSPDGHLLATCGQDCLLKVWALKSARPHFDDFSRLISNASKEQNENLTKRFNEFHQSISRESNTPTINARLTLNETQAPLYSKPFCILKGHLAPVLDMAWSKSLFLLSSSMDKTVRLWHLSRSECLCFFRHVDFVSAIAFHPRDDRYFVSASLDGHVRLWNIPDKRVVYWTLIPAQASSQIIAAQANLITAVNFCDDGRKVNVGTFDGRFLLYTDSLQYETVMNIGDKDGSRSHRSRKKRKKPCKITGIESMNSNNFKVLITSNDSRIRLYDIRSKAIERKYRGYFNQSSQIRATFSHDDQYIISGSEDSWFYIWKTEPNVPVNGNEASSASPGSAKLNRKQRRNFDRAFERIRVHNTMVTSAIFAPNSSAIMDYLYLCSDSTPLTHRANHTQFRTSLPTTAAAATATAGTTFTSNVNSTRARLINTQISANSGEGSMSATANGPIYVMVTADSKGQLKLLVNRFHR